MPTAFHYTSDSNWSFTVHGYFKGQRRLAPYRRLCEGLESFEWARRKYIFAFLEEQPQAWKNSREFPGIWDRTMRHVAHGDPVIRLLSFDLLCGDEAYVVDWAHMERAREQLHRWGNLCASSGDMEIITSSAVKYAETRVAAESYNGSYSLPELIISNPVELDRITSRVVR